MIKLIEKYDNICYIVLEYVNIIYRKLKYYFWK
jgi:hypothetical protein